MFLLGNKLLFRDFSIAKFAFFVTSLLSLTGTMFYELFQSVNIFFYINFFSFFVTESIALQLKGGVIDIASFNVPGENRKKLYIKYFFYRITYWYPSVILMIIFQWIIFQTAMSSTSYPLYAFLLPYFVYLIITMPLVVSLKRDPFSVHIMQCGVWLFYFCLLFQTSATEDVIQSNIDVINHIILVFVIILLFLSFFSFKWFCHILDKNPFVSLEIKKKHERWN